MKKRPWTVEEKQILKDNYGVLPLKDLLELLPSRTENSIYKQVSYLRQRGWTFGQAQI
jgi:hypothetical protein